MDDSTISVFSSHLLCIILPQRCTYLCTLTFCIYISREGTKSWVRNVKIRYIYLSPAPHNHEFNSIGAGQFFKNIVGKGENAGKHHSLLFPQNVFYHLKCKVQFLSNIFFCLRLQIESVSNSVKRQRADPLPLDPTF